MASGADYVGDRISCPDTPPFDRLTHPRIGGMNLERGSGKLVTEATRKLMPMLGKRQ